MSMVVSGQTRIGRLFGSLCLSLSLSLCGCRKEWYLVVFSIVKVSVRKPKRVLAIFLSQTSFRLVELQPCDGALIVSL